MSNQPALVPSDRDSRRRVRVSRTRRGPPDAPDRMNGMMTPWSDGTPMKPTCADRAERSSTGGAPKKVLVAGRMNVPRGPSASASAIVVTLPRNVAAPIRDLPMLLHHGTSFHHADARHGRRAAARPAGSGQEERPMKRPPRLLPFLAFGASLVVACTGAASPSPAPQSPVTSASPSAAASPITAPTGLI